jgi:MFS family permease
MINRNIIILFFTQSLGFSAVSFLVLLTGILAADFGPPKLATFPITLMVIGTAITTVPAAMLMRRFGRKNGTMGSYTLAIAGAVLGFFALRHSSFLLLCLSNLLIGAFMAFVNQFRFAAIESVPDKSKAGQVISFMLFGGVIAGFLGPQLADWGRHLYTPEFSGSFLLLVAILVISLLIFSNFRNPPPAIEQGDTAPARPLAEIMRQPVFLVALCSGVISYAIMSFLMTATPISMHQVDGFSFEQSRQVIQWHIAAMFLPSVFNIFLFRLLGIARLLLMGSMIYILLAALALQGHEFLHYGGSLIMLGVGWNFLFVAGTALLPQTYRESERFKVQAANDFIVFGIQAVSSLSAGWVLFTLGWDAMVWITVPASVLMLALSVYYYLKDISLTKAQRHEG